MTSQTVNLRIRGVDETEVLTMSPGRWRSLSHGAGTTSSFSDWSFVLETKVVSLSFFYLTAPKVLFLLCNRRSTRYSLLSKSNSDLVLCCRTLFDRVFVRTIFSMPAGDLRF